MSESAWFKPMGDAPNAFVVETDRVIQDHMRRELEATLPEGATADFRGYNRMVITFSTPYVAGSIQALYDKLREFDLIPG